MARPKGRPLPESHRERIREGMAFRNAMADAGEAVLSAAAEGDRTEILRAARRQLRSVQREFSDSPLIYRIMPPEEEECQDSG